MKKLSKKGSQKSSQSDPKRPLGRQGSIYSSIVSILGPVEKSSFFDVALGRRKIHKIEPWEGPQKSARAGSEVVTLGVKGPRAPRARYY